MDGGLVVKDMRVLLKMIQSQRAMFEKTDMGKAYFKARTEYQLGALLEDELYRWVSLASTGTTPSAAAVVVLGYEDSFDVQIMVRVAPGFFERLAALQASPKKSSLWSAVKTEDGFSVTVGSVTLLGILDGDVLRIAGTKEGLAQKPAWPELNAALKGVSHDGCQQFVFINGQGAFGGILSNLLEIFDLDSALSHLHQLAICSDGDGDKTTRLRILADAPGLSVLAPMLRPPDLNNDMLKLWGRDVTGFVNFTLPMPLISTLLTVLGDGLENTPFALPQILVSSLAALDGRMGLVQFDTAGDFALAIGFNEPKQAAVAMDGLLAWFKQVVQQEAPSLKNLLTYTALAKSEKGALWLRPDPDMEGFRIVPLDKSLLFVAQPKRALQLASQASQWLANNAAKEKALSTEFAGPLTPMVREVITRPAWMSGYWLSGSNSDWLLLGAYVARALAFSVKKDQPLFSKLPSPLDQIATATLDRWPLQVGFFALSMLLLYDMGFSIDLNGSVLIIDCVASWI